jgi:hypothetical protein
MFSQQEWDDDHRCLECDEVLERDECGSDDCDCHGSPLVHYSTGSEKCPGKDF